MTKLVTLSGNYNSLCGDLEQNNPLIYDDICLGMLFWSQVVKEMPDLTFADIKRIRTEQAKISLGAKWYERAWEGLSDKVGEVANWIADKSGDATRLIFLEESESGETPIGGIIDGVAAYFSGGKSAALKNMGEGENGSFLDNVLGFFGGTGEKVRADIKAAGITDPSTQFEMKPEYLIFGGGFLLLILVIVLATNKKKTGAPGYMIPAPTK